MGKPLSERIEERRQASIEFFADEKRKSGFWRFFSDLATIGPPVIWSNLARIGVVRPGKESEPLNPWSRKTKDTHPGPLDSQEELARMTLKGEIEEYRPSLVILVTGTYALKEIVYPVFGTKKTWKEEAIGKRGIWWIEADLPILRTYHPERKSQLELKHWLLKAELLSRSKEGSSMQRIHP